MENVVLVTKGWRGDSSSVVAGIVCCAQLRRRIVVCCCECVKVKMDSLVQLSKWQGSEIAQAVSTGP